MFGPTGDAIEVLAATVSRLIRASAATWRSRLRFRRANSKCGTRKRH